MSDNVMDRRQVLGRGAALAGIAALSTEALFAAEASAGYKATSAYKGTLKIVGLGVDLTPDIKAAWETKFPDVTLEFTVKSTPEISQIALTQPESQDLMSGYFHQMDQLWPSGTSSSCSDPTNIARWGEVTRLHKLGALAEGGQEGQGDAPFRKIFLEDDGARSPTGETEQAHDVAGQPQLRLVRLQREGARAAGLVGDHARRPVQGPRRAHQRPRDRHHRRRAWPSRPPAS